MMKSIHDFKNVFQTSRFAWLDPIPVLLVQSRWCITESGEEYLAMVTLILMQVMWCVVSWGIIALMKFTNTQLSDDWQGHCGYGGCIVMGMNRTSQTVQWRRGTKTVRMDGGNLIYNVHILQLVFYADRQTSTHHKVSKKWSFYQRIKPFLKESFTLVSVIMAQLPHVI